MRRNHKPTTLQVYTSFCIRRDQLDFAEAVPDLTSSDWLKLKSIMVVLSVCAVY